jgi:hypothetical protein
MYSAVGWAIYEKMGKVRVDRHVKYRNDMNQIYIHIISLNVNY